MRRIVRIAFVLIAVVMVTGRVDVWAQPSAPAAAGASASPAALDETLKPGTIIGADNVEQYARYIPGAGKFAIGHGFKMRVAPARRVEWSAGFRHATEKYSS